MTEDSYRGIPLRDLPIIAVDWSFRADHIRHRSRRKNNKAEKDLEPEWATESATDPRALVARGAGDSIPVVGWSSSIRMVLTVILVGKDIAQGEWWGASAWVANRNERVRYGREEPK